MEQLTTDWDPQAFPRVLDGEISRFLRQTRFNTPWLNALTVLLIGALALRYSEKMTHTNLAVSDYLVILVPLLLASIVMVLVQYNSLAHHGEQAVETIIRSGLIGRLPDAAGWISEVYQWTPVPIKALYLGPPPENMQRWARLLAVNLDWYLHLPQRYVRREWYPLVGMVLLVLSGYPILHFKCNIGILLTWNVLVGLVLVAAVPYSFLQLMKSRRTLQVFQQLLRSGGVFADQPGQ